MENKINIAELLKDCPKGMELDCTLYENASFIGIAEGVTYPICVKINLENVDEKGWTREITLTSDGKLGKHPNAKCIIFPKGKTTWEGFHRPFEDGNILFVKSAYSWVLIYKESENKEDLHKYVAIPIHPKHTYIVYDNNPLCCKEDVSEIRFATEEEKQKLFQAIKDNGYKWNSETKTLEKLVEPKFKVGDRIKEKQSNIIGEIIDVQKNKYNVRIDDKGLYLYFREQGNWELVPNKFDIDTLKPFDKVLVRDVNDKNWVVNIFGYYRHETKYPFYCSGNINVGFKQCIPYEKNEHLLGTTNDCDEFYKTW